MTSTSRRRTVLLGGLAAGLFGGLLARPALAETFDYTSRSTFDYFDKVFHESGAVGQPTDNNEHGELAWGQSYVLLSFLRMYEAYRDTYYLDRLVHNADLVIANRDSARGVTDYRGLSLPAWRAMHPYTVGVAKLSDILEVRSALSYADDATATVRSSATEGLFTLEVTNAHTARTDTFADVSMDPSSPAYVVRRVYDAYPGKTMTTVRDLRATPGPGDPPTVGATTLASCPVYFAVHTGMVTYALAAFCRTIKQNPALHARYLGKAEEYLRVVRAAASVHDREWRETASGSGFFQWVKGMPVPYDGTEQPMNQSLGLGLTYAEIAAATGDKVFARRARQLAQFVKGELTVDAGDAYTWYYWPKFGVMYKGFAKTGDPATDVSIYTPSYGSPSGGARQIEDLSHGAIDIEFAVLAFRRGLYFNGQDMARFARTYSRNLATTADGVATNNLRVDGSGGLAPEGQYLQSPRWMPVAPWDETTFTHSRQVYVDHDVQPGFGSGLLAVAYLNWFARRR